MHLNVKQEPSLTVWVFVGILLLVVEEVSANLRLHHSHLNIWVLVHLYIQAQPWGP